MDSPKQKAPKKKAARIVSDLSTTAAPSPPSPNGTPTSSSFSSTLLRGGSAEWAHSPSSSSFAREASSASSSFSSSSDQLVSFSQRHAAAAAAAAPDLAAGGGFGLSQDRRDPPVSAAQSLVVASSFSSASLQDEPLRNDPDPRPRPLPSPSPSPSPIPSHPSSQISYASSSTFAPLSSSPSGSSSSSTPPSSHSGASPFGGALGNLGLAAANLPNLPNLQLPGSFQNILPISLGAEQPGRMEEQHQQHQHSTERENLLNIFRLSVKALLSSGLDLGEPLTDESPELIRFCVVLEHVFQHGLKVKRTLFGRKKEYWEFIENLEKIHPPSAQLIVTVRSLGGITTSLGRGRAFVRSALMQKTLPDYWRILFEENPALVNDWYEPWSILRGDEIPAISGILMGLNALDFNFFLKGEDLEKQSTALDWSLFLKDGNVVGSRDRSAPEPEPEDPLAVAQRKLNAAIDQKAYLEEMNKRLEKKLQQANEKIEQLTLSQGKGETKIIYNQIAAVDKEASKATEQLILTLKNEILDLKERHQRELESLRISLAERDTSEAKTEATTIYEGLRNTLDTERKLRLELEKELNAERLSKNFEFVELKKQIASLGLDLQSVKDKRNLVMEENEHLRKQLSEANALSQTRKAELDDSLQVSRNIQEELKEFKAKNATLLKNKKETKALQEIIDQQKAEIQGMRSELLKSQEEMKKAEEEMRVSEKRYAELERNLTAELEESNKKGEEIDFLQKKMKATLEDLDLVQKEKAKLQGLVREREDTLADMADQYGKSQMMLVNLAEYQDAMKSEKWMSDKEVTHCLSCEEAFSINRRKHHCRSCGKIYCANCSDNKMTLASSKKPVRVCDSCYDRHLQKHSVV